MVSATGSTWTGDPAPQASATRPRRAPKSLFPAAAEPPTAAPQRRKPRRLMDENSRRAEPWDAMDVVREATVVSALESAARAEELGLPVSHFLDEGIGSIGERELQDRQYEEFKALPDDVRAFVVKPVNVAYLRVAMHLAHMPADTIRRIAEGLLEITY